MRYVSSLRIRYVHHGAREREREREREIERERKRDEREIKRD